MWCSMRCRWFAHWTGQLLAGLPVDTCSGGLSARPQLTFSTLSHSAPPTISAIKIRWKYNHITEHVIGYLRSHYEQAAQQQTIYRPFHSLLNLTHSHGTFEQSPHFSLLPQTSTFPTISLGPRNNLCTYSELSQSNPRDLQIKMTDSITTDFSNMDLETEATSVSDSAHLEVTIQSLIDRCTTLYNEAETYVAAVIAKQKQTRVQHPVEYRNLRTDFKNELAFLKKIAGAKMDEDKARHFIVSSNLLYYEALWGAAKRATSLQAFRKYFYWDKKARNTTKGKGGASKGKTNALADIVADEGAEWLRVSTLSEKRLLFDLAKLGWMNDSDSDEDMPDIREDDDDDDEDQVDIVKNARQLARAARANPIRGRPPKVRFVLTRIVAGKTKEIDNIIQKIRATGATVQCANDIPPTPTLKEVLPSLLVDRSQALSLSHTLNIDCTILLALISDISHHECSILDWYPGEVRAQIQEEAKENLLPTHLYPAIGSHRMATVQQAADQMNLIVQTLATDTEKGRADLLLGQGESATKTREELLSEWSALSSHAIPGGFQLPIRVVPVDMSIMAVHLPAAAMKLYIELGALNRAIFLFGWAQGLTTLTANRGRARQIEAALNEHGLEEDETGPHIWLCGESRSLIAKHGRRN